MKKIIVILTVFLVMCGGTYLGFSQSMSITGGNDHAVVICSEGYMYAWGNNNKNQLALAPPNDIVDVIWEPQPVESGGLTFSQVTAGSGSHNVALSCNGIVYAWGANDGYQTGQIAPSGAGSVVDEILPVGKGATPGYNIDGSPGGIYLGGVKMIAASTSASFALLETGEVVGWGGNGDGGGWVAAATPDPFYITDEDGDRLTDIIHVSGGDNNALFLQDADGDGLGTLYSIGNWNGRGGDGAATSTFAAPVLDEDGNELNTIKMSGIMDVGGFAVDGVTGYVYGWGNGGWGCSNGLPNNQTTTFASKVEAGEYQTISGEEYLTDVVQVMGGNGYGAAITKEGYLLYWGNNTPEAGNGGAAPRPFPETDACDYGPIFGEYCDGSVVDDAVAISRGDMWGFMINEANEYYVWGSNSQAGATANYVGTLGLGDPSIKYVDCVTPLAIPCEIPDPCPEAYMVGPLYKCAGQSTELFSGFTTPTGLEDRYYFRWYKDGVLLNTTTKDDPLADRQADVYNNTTIEIDEVGEYNVEIEYIDANVPCNACKIAEASIEVLDKEMPIEDLDITSCVDDPLNPTASDMICFEFLSNYLVDSDFEVYSEQTGGTALQTLSIDAATGLGEFCVTGDNVTATERSTDTIYTLYLEDITTIGGAVLESINLTESGSPQDQKLILEAWKPIALQSFDMDFKSYYGPATGVVTPVIYNVDKNNNGQEIPGSVFHTGSPQTINFEDTPTTVTVDLEGVELPANPVRGSKYILAFEYTGDNCNIFYTELGANQPDQSPLLVNPHEDNIDGGTLLVIGALENSGDNPTNKSVFKNIQFNSLSAYDCGRMPITSTYYCPPCAKPDEFTISITDTDSTLCPDESTTLETSPAQSDATQFSFEWFKDDLSTSIDGPNSGASSSWTVDYGNEGTYYVRAFDKDNPTSSDCFREDSIVVKDAVKPEFTISGGDEYCDGDDVLPVSVEFTAGVAPFDIEWDVVSATTSSNSEIDITTSTFDLGTDEGTYSVTSLSDKYCEADANSANETIKINPIPEGTITYNHLEYCAPTSDVLLDLEGISGGVDISSATVSWYKDGTAIATSALTGAEAGEYYAVISMNSCEFITDTVTVIENAQPDYTITAGGEYCEGDVITP
ncbi:MAG: RCC1 domain-containing protein, partial [Bacteroidota bacterium]